MKTPRKIIFAIILLVSPILAAENNKDNADITQKEPTRKSRMEIKDRTTEHELKPVIDPSDNIKNLPEAKKPTAHFIGDAYGWIIVYY